MNFYFLISVKDSKCRHFIFLNPKGNDGWVQNKNTF